jgi:hypothetical protein
MAKLPISAIRPAIDGWHFPLMRAEQGFDVSSQGSIAGARLIEVRGPLVHPQSDGGHTDGPNIEHFIKWADGLLR